MHCPLDIPSVDAFRHNRSTQESTSSKGTSKVSVTHSLIFINVAVYLVDTFITKGTLFRWGVKHNGLIAAGQWWRLLSSTYLHGGLIHLAVRAVSFCLCSSSHSNHLCRRVCICPISMSVGSHIPVLTSVRPHHWGCAAHIDVLMEPSPISVEWNVCAGEGGEDIREEDGAIRLQHRGQRDDPSL
jgi:hypothetical protein